MAPVTRSRCCQACRQPMKSTSKEASSSSSVDGSLLCPDCLLAVEIAAEDAFEPDDRSNDDTVSSSEAVEETEVTSIYLTLSPDEALEEKFRQSVQSNSVLKLQVKLLHNESSQIHGELLDVQNQSLEETSHMRTSEHRLSGKSPQVPTVVTPDKKRQRDATSSAKLCVDCSKRPVPEDFMLYCKPCYAQRCRKSREQEENGMVYSSAQTTFAGKCRLCKGSVLDQSYEYCLKCYHAKKRDDAKLAEKQRLEAAPRTASAPRGPCTDCGGPIAEPGEWRTKCRPCFRKHPVKRPRLLYTPKKVLWIRKST